MDANDRKKYEEELNARFREQVSRGEDVTSYFHVPKKLLTEEIENYLNELLDEMAFNLAFSDAKGFQPEEKMVVYMDQTHVLYMETQDKKLEVLKKLLKHFERKENYERCTQILEAIQTIQATLKEEEK